MLGGRRGLCLPPGLMLGVGSCLQPAQKHGVERAVPPVPWSKGLDDIAVPRSASMSLSESLLWIYKLEV